MPVLGRLTPSPFKGQPLDGHPALTPAPAPAKVAPQKTQQAIPRAKSSPLSGPLGGTMGALPGVGKPSPLAQNQSVGAKTGTGLFGSIGNFASAAYHAAYGNHSKLGTLPSQAPGMAMADPNIKPGLEKDVKESIELPVQTGSSLYQVGKVGVESFLHPGGGAGKQFINELTHGSAIGAALSGNEALAVKLAGEHQLTTALEILGAGSGVDVAAGEVARTGALGSKLADAASLHDTPVDDALTSRQPKPTDTHATLPQKPYSRGLVRNMLEKKDALHTPITDRIGGAVAKDPMVKKLDTDEGLLHSNNLERHNEVLRQHTTDLKPLKTDPGIVPQLFLKGVLSHPSVVDEHGIPEWRNQLSRLAQKWEQKPNMGKDNIESATQRATRMKNVEAAHSALNDEWLRNNADKVYTYAKNAAARKSAMEPDLAHNSELSADHIKVAKLLHAAKFHYPDIKIEDGQLTKAGEPLTAAKVEGMLRDKGVEPNDLGYVSHDPNRSPDAGHSSSPAVPETAGKPDLAASHKLTGVAFTRGHADLSPEHIADQEVFDTRKIAEGQQNVYKAEQFAHTQDQAAKMFEDRLDKVAPEDLAFYKQLITSLKNGKYWNQIKGNQSPWDLATHVANQLRALDPKADLVPGAVMHRFAPSGYSSQFLSNLEDHLEPKDEGREPSQFPEDAQAQKSVGKVALYSRAVADRMKSYEKIKAADPSPMNAIGQWWRNNAIAFSIKHYPGVMAEFMEKAVAANMGPVPWLANLRGHMAMKAVEDMKELDPVSYQRLRGYVGGTLQNWNTQLDRSRIDTKWSAIKNGDVKLPQKAAVPFQKWLGLTRHLQNFYRRVFEKPFQIAALGKFANDELKRLNRGQISIFKNSDQFKAELGKSLLKTKSVDSLVRTGQEWFGDYQSASPPVKQFATVMPFVRWFQVALRFIYRNMPLDHPTKTGVASLMYDMSRQTLENEGQGYGDLKNALLGAAPSNALTSYQQGSIPNPFGGPLSREDAQYYSPPGAISEGIKGALSDIFPPAQIAKETIEKNSEGIEKGVPSGIAEALFPPARYPTSILAEGKGVKSTLFPFRVENAKLGKGKSSLLKRGNERHLPSRSLPSRTLPSRTLPERTLPER